MATSPPIPYFLTFMRGTLTRGEGPEPTHAIPLQLLPAPQQLAVILSGIDPNSTHVIPLVEIVWCVTGLLFGCVAGHCERMAWGALSWLASFKPRGHTALQSRGNLALSLILGVRRAPQR